jgi:endoglucanase
MLALFALGVASADWYSTSGKNLKNGAGSTVRLSGLNWFGFETTNEVFHGLWAHGLHDMVTEVAQRSFNCWRIPISAKVLQDWKAGQPLAKWGNNPMYNQDLEGKTNLDVFDAFVADVKKAGKMKIYLDCHSVLDGTYMNNLWYDGTHPPEYVIGALEWFAKRYKDEDTIVGIDVKNEPHGRCDKTDAATWDESSSQTNWKHFVEQAAARIHAVNRNLLILVEGIECYKNIWGWWGGNLVPVKEYPIKLGVANKLVYAPHEYGPAVSQQKWFHAGFSYDTLYKEHWQEQWMYIIEGDIAPILIGEWGGHTTGDDATWMKATVQLITKYGLSQTFWCLNPNSGDTGGLLNGDWKTWDEVKYNIIKPCLVK